MVVLSAFKFVCLCALQLSVSDAYSIATEPFHAPNHSLQRCAICSGEKPDLICQDCGEHYAHEYCAVSDDAADDADIDAAVVFTCPACHDNEEALQEAHQRNRNDNRAVERRGGRKRKAVRRPSDGSGK